MVIYEKQIFDSVKSFNNFRFINEHIYFGSFMIFNIDNFIQVQSLLILMEIKMWRQNI